MSVFWAEAAVLPGGIAERVRIDEAGGRIVSVRADAEPTGTVLRGLVLPGLANGHSHVFHRALRGTTHADGGTFWNWRERMYRVAASLDPDGYRELATAIFAEMVLAGYTVVGEFHYLHGVGDGARQDGAMEDGAMEEAVLEAAAAAGIRITLLDTLYLQGGVGAALRPEQARFGDGTVAAWATRRAGVARSLEAGSFEAGSFEARPLQSGSHVPSSATARIGAAIHSVRAVAPAAIAEVAALDLAVVHAHVSEQPAENEQAIAEWGATPVELFAELLGDRFTAVHATHLTSSDVAALGTSFACFCPTTERDLADGIGPARRLADAGARLTLGSDQNAVIDPFEELRGLEMHERLASGRRGRFDPAELLRIAGANGYASLGWDEASLSAGSLCDLVAVATDSVRTAGSELGQLWLSATAADVSTVVVGGDIVVRDGRHRLGDVAGLLATAIGRTRA